MEIYEVDLKIPVSNESDIFKYLEQSLLSYLGKKKKPIRFVITSFDANSFHCEIGVLEGDVSFPSIFDFDKREYQNCDEYNIVLMIPTGIGAEIGGHAGDGCPLAKFFSPLCHNLITHPNVVNGAYLNEIPENGLYVEGSMLCRLLMGTVGLAKVNINRVLFLLENYPDQVIKNDCQNSFNAARACYGLNGEFIVEIDPPMTTVLEFTASKRATGRVSQLENILNVINTHRNEFDALALATNIQAPDSLPKQYLECEGKMVNPWGGVEAIFTHALSLIYECPSAHSPMSCAKEKSFLINGESGVIDPRIASETFPTTSLNCIFKGLQKSPRIVTNKNRRSQKGVIGVEDVACLIIPDGCLSLPIFAALEQGITVIAVKENRNLMKNDLAKLPWQKGQFYQVENYWEAAGVISAIKGSIAPESVRRPIKRATFKQN